MRVAAVLVVLLLALAGCGGDSDDSTKEYLADAEKICIEARQRLEMVFAEEEGGATLEEIPGLASQQKQIERDALERLRNLEPPADLRDQVRSWLSLLEDDQRRLDQLIRAAEAGREAGVRGAEAQLAELLSRRSAAARDVGFEDSSVCRDV